MTTTTTTEQIGALLAAGGTVAEVAAELSLGVGRADDGSAVVLLDGWVADDGNAEIEIVAESGEDAAREYVGAGDWGDASKTTWVKVWAWRVGVRRVECAYCTAVASAHDADGNPACAEHAETPRAGAALSELCEMVEVDRDSHTVAIEPTEPDCDAGEAHDWASPQSIVGGIDENPGVQGHGGGVIATEVCLRCGCRRDTDTWAQCRETGEQGLTAVEYTVGEYSAEIASRRDNLVRASIDVDDGDGPWHAIVDGAAEVAAIRSAVGGTCDVRDDESGDPDDTRRYVTIEWRDGAPARRAAMAQGGAS
jgi:hypothetical protein